MRILVTGSRDWTDRKAIYQALQDHVDEATDAVIIVTGACPTGADLMAEQFAQVADLALERHPADWYRYGAAAGPLRNAEMVQAGADVCLAFQRRGSRGTQNTIDLASAAGIPVVLHTDPDDQGGG